MPRRIGRFCDSHGIRVRPAAGLDFATIWRLARLRFPLPVGWDRVPENVARYSPAVLGRSGTRVVVAANRAGQPAGYAMYQLRPDGDVYLEELAAAPPGLRGAAPLAGTLLLGFALEDALEAGRGPRATLNVVAVHRRPNAAPGWRDPVAFYEQFGFRESDEPGYTSTGRPRPRHDTWMRADLGDALDRLIDRLTRRFVTAIPSGDARGSK